MSIKNKVVTASIVLYNTPRSQVDVVLESVMGAGCVGTLYVIDNSPNDRWRVLERQYPAIRYIHSENLGYGAGHNLAIREAIDTGSDYHVVLNPDIRFGADVLPALTQFMDANPDAAYVLPKVVSPDGEVQRLCKLLPTPFDLILRRFLPRTRLLSRLNDRYELVASGYDRVMNPPCLSGCFMFLRLATLAAHNLFFDEDYFMYCEDFDLIRRIHRVAGTLYYPEVTIVHDHARESYRSRRMLAAHINSAVRYFNKWGWIFDAERRAMNRKILEEMNCFPRETDNE